MYFDPTTCTVCGKSYNKSMTAMLDCPHCKAEKEQKNKEKYLKKLSEMTIEERLAKLEEGLYDLARRPPVHVPSPLY